MTTTVQIGDKVLVIPPIRLSVDEARSLLELYVSGNKPPKPYRADMLVKIGLATETPVKPKATAADEAQAWKALLIAAKAKNLSEVRRLYDSIGNIRYRADRKECTYALTALGREVARGITVKMGRRT